VESFGGWLRDELLADELLAVEAFSTLIADGPTTGVPVTTEWWTPRQDCVGVLAQYEDEQAAGLDGSSRPHAEELHSKADHPDLIGASG